MRVEAIELRQLEIPMIEPLAAAHGSVENRTTIVIRVITDVAEGWGECVALHEPTYIADWSNGEWTLMSELFGPELIGAPQITAQDVQRMLGRYRSHHTSKAGLELAVLDAQLRAEGRSLASFLDAPATHVQCAIVVGMFDGDTLINIVERHLKSGYRQIKLKIEPGHDVERIDLVHKHFPDLPIRVDANGSYDWDNADHRRALLDVDQRDLVFIEQPVAPGNARAYRDMHPHLTTPVALDESVVSFARAMDAIDILGCEALVLKPGLIGGYLTARDMHDECRRRSVATMVGGMLETGVARAANLALAAMPGFSSLPAEVCPDGRWFKDTILTEAVTMTDGMIAVPTGPGLGVDVDMGALNRLTRRVHIIRRGD